MGLWSAAGLTPVEPHPGLRDEVHLELLRDTLKLNKCLNACYDCFVRATGGTPVFTMRRAYASRAGFFVLLSKTDPKSLFWRNQTRNSMAAAHTANRKHKWLR